MTVDKPPLDTDIPTCWAWRGRLRVRTQEQERRRPSVCGAEPEAPSGLLADASCRGDPSILGALSLSWPHDFRDQRYCWGGA